MIDEKRLMSRMKENYRKGGYRVGNIMDSGRELLTVSGETWYAAVPAVEASNDLKALIVQHTGQLPGRAVTVQRDGGVQMMMSGELEKIRKDAMSKLMEAQICGKTPLTLGGYEIWQSENGRCAMFSPEVTGIFTPGDDEARYGMVPGLLCASDMELHAKESRKRCWRI